VLAATSSLELEDFVLAKFYCPRALANGSQRFQIREKVLEFSSTVFSTLPPYLHTYTFNGPLSGTTRVSQYQRGKTNLDFAEVKRW